MGTMLLAFNHLDNVSVLLQQTFRLILVAFRDRPPVQGLERHIRLLHTDALRLGRQTQCLFVQQFHLPASAFLPVCGVGEVFSHGV